MNQTLQDFARQKLRDGLAKLPNDHLRMFRLMYARNVGKRLVADAVLMPIADVVEEIPANRLSWALTQVENGLADEASKLEPIKYSCPDFRAVRDDARSDQVGCDVFDIIPAEKQK